MYPNDYRRLHQHNNFINIWFKNCRKVTFLMQVKSIQNKKSVAFEKLNILEAV
jgi:hypothetical protein